MSQIIATYDMKDRLASFVDFLKDRVCDPTYEDKRELIADFLDKFLVVEMKRLQDSKDIREETIEIPRDVLLEPLRKARTVIDGEFKKLLGDTTEPVAVQEQLPLDEPDVPADKDKPARNGNGHLRLKKRELTDAERDTIRASFLKVNGEIDEDSCLPIKAECGSEVTIFQVTGFVTYLHRQVAAGATKVRDIQSYESFLKAHRNLWATYDSPKYRAMRGKV
jgi:hypothetical protein